MSTYVEFRTCFLDKLIKRGKEGQMEPVSVELTADAEEAISTISRNEGGDEIVAQIAKDGVRASVPSYLGVKVSKWDADVIKFID